MCFYDILYSPIQLGKNYIFMPLFLHKTESEFCYVIVYMKFCC